MKTEAECVRWAVEKLLGDDGYKVKAASCPTWNFGHMVANDATLIGGAIWRAAQRDTRLDAREISEAFAASMKCLVEMSGLKEFTDELARKTIEKALAEYSARRAQR